MGGILQELTPDPSDTLPPLRRSLPSVLQCVRSTFYTVYGDARPSVLRLLHVDGSLRSHLRVTDVDLLARLRNGDATAFDEIFREWYPPLVRYVQRMLRDQAAAEDIAQEAMLELWRRRDRLTGDGPFHAYLWQSARNRALNHIRHARVTERAEPHVVAVTPEQPHADAHIIESEIEQALRAAVDGLPPRCREVFQLSRVRGLKNAEIAETLGVSIKAVEAQMGKALRVLRERLAPWLPQSDTM